MKYLSQFIDVTSNRVIFIVLVLRLNLLVIINQGFFSDANKLDCVGTNDLCETNENVCIHICVIAQ